MSINSFEINGAEINGVAVIATLSGTLVTVQQEVRELLSGTLVTVQQEVELRETLSGTLVTVEQSVVGSIAGTVVTVSQDVRDAADVSRLARRGYDCQIYLAGYQIPDEQLTEELVIEFNENNAATASIVLFPGPGVQDLSFYYGKAIAINLTKPSGSATRVFTGVVDIVDFDVINGKTFLQCTDRRKELLDAIPSPTDKFGTSYDTSLIETYEGSNSEIIDKLLPYADSSLDFDAFNQYHYTSWTPKATADFTLSGSEVFRRDPNIELVYRGRIINQVNISYTYEFSRLHYREVLNTWRAGIQGFPGSGTAFGTFLREGRSLVRRETIRSAAEGGGWILKNAVSYDDLPPPGWYGGIGWLGDQQRWNLGNNGATASGFSSYNITTSSSSSSQATYAAGATWTGTRRFSQKLQKTYTITVTATDSQALFGTVSRDSSYSIQDPYDASRWDNYAAYESSFNVGNGQTIALNTSKAVDVVTIEGKSNENLKAAVQRARVEILKSHRENTVTAETPIMPELQLYHTLAINSTQIQAKGKVSSYRHVVNFTTTDSFTEFEIKFYQLGAGGSNTALELPAISTPLLGGVRGSNSLPSYYGVQPPSDSNFTRSGFYGNKIKSGLTTRYQESFIVLWPAVPGTMTDGQNFSGTATYDTNIPTGTLTITYD